MVEVEQLTQRQREVFEFIREATRAHGYPPTVREIGEHFEIASPNGVMCHLKALERKGLIRRGSNKSRAIELTEPLAEQSGLPYVGQVAAGPTTLAFEQDEYLDFGEMFHRSNRFVLQVRGDSMIEAHIEDGDFVIVEKRKTATPGTMVVAQTDEGEATLKYWHPEKNRVRLQPANASMEPIYSESATVLGVVVGVVRKVR